MDNYVGKRLDGRYEVHEIIGVGGMSVVYKAYDNIDDRIVAVKILKDEFLANEEFRRRFKNESKAIAVMSHPNIVRVYDVNFGERLQYIVMEHVDGITLKEYIQRQGFVQWREAVHFATQILRALQHAHDKGIVHRDIKPQNIILLQNGNIKVTDFGIARFSRSDTRTMTEKAIGSVHYISPEQARGDITDEKADIYSLGVVLYEMLTGTVPFEADSAVSVAIMQLQANARMPRDINPEIPIGLEQITMHAMQKLPVDRYQSATEMLLDIDEIYRNPNAVFDYKYFLDAQPTKYMDQVPQSAYKDESDDYDDYDQNDLADDYDEEDDKKKTVKIITAVAVGAVVLIATIVILVLSLSGNLSGNKVEVPEFKGLDFETQIRGKDFGVTFDEPEYEVTNNYAEGTVIDQTPEAGQKVKKGSKVKLVIAASEQDVTVPDVYGQTLTKAKQMLKDEGLVKYEIVQANSEEVEEGHVIYTQPARNSSAKSTDKITIYVSLGTETQEVGTAKIPSLRNLAKDDITKYLKAAGFTNISFEVEDSEEKKNMFIRVSPSENSVVAKDSAIVVTISSGVAPTTKPTLYDATIKIVMPNISKTTLATVVLLVDGVQVRSESCSMSGGTVVFDKIPAAEREAATYEVLIVEYDLSYPSGGKAYIDFTSKDTITIDAFKNFKPTSDPGTTNEDNTTDNGAAG